MKFLELRCLHGAAIFFFKKRHHRPYLQHICLISTILLNWIGKLNFFPIIPLLLFFAVAIRLFALLAMLC